MMQIPVEPAEDGKECGGVSLEGIAMRIQNGGMIQINNKDDPSPFALIGGGGRFGGRFGGRVWW